MRNFLISLVAVVGAASAQSYVFVPSSSATNDSVAGGRLPGLRRTFRMQVIVGASHLAGIAAPCTALAFRRDGQYLDALEGGRSSFTIRISDQGAAPAQTRDLFAANHAVPPVQVFSGPVDYPASPAITAPDQSGWLPQHVIEFPFASPFQYRGGSLCIEIEGTGVIAGEGPWRADFFADFGARGSVHPFGAGCGQYAGEGQRGASGQPATLTVGSTTRVYTWGQPGSPAFLMLGLQPLGAPLDALGAPGCFLHVVPELTLTSWLTTPTRTDLPGHVPFALQLPSEASLLSGTFLVQTGNLELRAPFTNAAHLTTSQGMRLVIGPRTPTLDAAVVESRHVFPFPDSGSVDMTRAPVLRLTTN